MRRRSALGMLLGLSLLQTAYGQPGVETAGAVELLAAHNHYRRAVGVPDLVWSERLAGLAQDWADRALIERGCRRLRTTGHRPDDEGGRGVGENIAYVGAIPRVRDTPAQIVGGWASERRDYDHGTNTCRTGRQCGHYTQIVWRHTRQVGCGVVACTDGDWHRKLWVCNYSPPGNVVGQRPY